MKHIKFLPNYTRHTTASVGPYKACMKFAEVQQMLQERYPSDQITTQQVVKLLQWVFPHATTEHTTYITGIRCWPASTPELFSLVPSPPITQLSSAAVSPLSQVQSIQAENTWLLARVAELESENQQLIQVYEQQLQRLSTSSSILIHGSDTVERFERFSIDAVISVVKQFGPDLLGQFNRLADVRRNLADDYDDLTAGDQSVDSPRHTSECQI